MTPPSDSDTCAFPEPATRRSRLLGTSEPTLVCDLDGTLTPTDTLLESFVGAVRRHPLTLLYWPMWLMKGRSSLKYEIAKRSDFDARSLPIREDFRAYIQEARDGGRRIVLATAADQRIADSVVLAIPLFDACYGSDGQTNLKGPEKLALILEREGAVFSYAGDSTADLIIWKASHSAVLVGASHRLEKIVRATTAVEAQFASTSVTTMEWFKAVRVHQWLKNVLVFVPLFTSFSFMEPASILAGFMAFVAFSLLASGTYIGNDIWDIENDRKHARKRHRAIASGRITLKAAFLAQALLLFAGLTVSATVSFQFTGILLLYFVLTTAYSLVLKRYVLLDVITLAALYALRVLAGAIAIGVSVSPWLLGFSLFTFVSLALVKRCSELVSIERDGDNASSGRDYRVSDLGILWPMGVGAAMCAVVVFGLFVAHETESQRYANPALLWGVGVGLLYWLGRLWIKTHRGEMHDDPIIFTLKDRGSRSVLTVILLLTASAFFL